MSRIPRLCAAHVHTSPSHSAHSLPNTCPVLAVLPHRDNEATAAASPASRCRLRRDMACHIPIVHKARAPHSLPAPPPPCSPCTRAGHVQGARLRDFLSGRLVCRVFCDGSRSLSVCRPVTRSFTRLRLRGVTLQGLPFKSWLRFQVPVILSSAARFRAHTYRYPRAVLEIYRILFIVIY